MKNLLTYLYLRKNLMHWLNEQIETDQEKIFLLLDAVDSLKKYPTSNK